MDRRSFIHAEARRRGEPRGVEIDAMGDHMANDSAFDEDYLKLDKPTRQSASNLRRSPSFSATPRLRVKKITN